MGQAARAMRSAAALERGSRGLLLAEWILSAPNNALSARYPVSSAGVNTRSATQAGAAVAGAFFSSSASQLALDTSNIPITVDAWMTYNTTAYATLIICALQSGGYHGFWWRTSSGGTRLSWFGDGRFADNLGAEIPNDGKLHHVALTVEGVAGVATTLTPYLDGVAGSAFWNGFSYRPNGTAAHPLYVGAATPTGSPTVNGKIALARVWKRVLTAAEIRRLYVLGPNSIAARQSARSMGGSGLPWLPVLLSRRGGGR